MLQIKIFKNNTCCCNFITLMILIHCMMLLLAAFIHHNVIISICIRPHQMIMTAMMTMDPRPSMYEYAYSAIFSYHIATKHSHVWTNPKPDATSYRCAISKGS